jgi:hypothetical protein
VSDVLTLGDSSTRPRIAWESVLDTATITSPSTAEDDGAVAQAADWRPWTFWRPTGAAPHRLEAVLVGTPTVCGWALAGHDASGSVTLDTWDGTAWVAHSEVIAAGDGACLYVTGALIATTKVRLRFASISFLAMAWVGTDVILPAGVGPGWTDPVLALRAEINPEVSRDGVWLGAAIEQWTATLALDIKNVEAAWALDEWLPFLRQCSTRPFFLNWNTTDWPASACLCTGATFGTTAFSGNGFVDLSVSFRADPGLDRRSLPDDDAPALMLESSDGPLLLE